MLAIPEKLIQFAAAAQQAGGRAICVGGGVRDLLRGQVVADWDMEVYGMTVKAFEEFLPQFGTPQLVGRAFGVYRLASMNLDVSLPRKDNLIGVGHRGFHVTVDPHLAFVDALKRRDLTINSMGYDPLTDELIDPYGGLADLHHKILRPTHLESFAEDPLRGMRVAQFLARLDMEAHPDLIVVCRGLDMDALSPERILKEFEKMLLQGIEPSRGLMFLEQTTLLRFFPALALLRKGREDQSLPCGDPWVRTLGAVDEAAHQRQGDRQQDLALMFGALCHAFFSTEQVQKFMGTLKASALLEKRVCGLVKWHGFPVRLQRQGAGSGAYRRLARALHAHALCLRDLSRLTQVVMKADGNGLPEWEEKALSYGVFDGPPQDAVTGKFLMAQGAKAGKAMGEAIQACRDIQDEHPSWCAKKIFEAAKNLGKIPF